MPAVTPRVATANSFNRQPAAGQRALRTNGIHRILRTTWRKTAAAARPEQKNERGRNRPAIQPDEEDQNGLGNIQQPTFNIEHPMPAGALRHWELSVECWMLNVFHFSKFARFNTARKSFSTSANFLPAIELRATSTSSTGCAISFWCCRKLSRNSRRARLRTTAPPMRRLVTTPNRGTAPSGNGCQLAMRQPSASRCPCCRTRAKSRCCRSRAARRRRRRPAAGVRNGLASGDEADMNTWDTRIKRVSDVCVPRDGGCAAWRGHFWWTCGREIRAVVCAGFLTVDTGVS